MAATAGGGSGEAAGVPARALAVRALVRIDTEGAYANLVVPALLSRSGLEAPDRHLVTELVYGTTRMRRACDWLLDRFCRHRPDPTTLAVLRLGAYQLAFTGIPDHAAVDTSVAVARRRARGLVNAVLRKVATADRDWPSDGLRLSYPDWIIDRLVDDLGRADALGALEAMNRRPAVHQRPDGYVQDPASTMAAAAVGAGPGELVVELCAAPGGKATAMAQSGARVVAADADAGRAGLIVANATRTGVGSGALTVVVGDGRRPALRPGQANRVLVDAPCSGLGVLGRRPDARWRLDPDAPERLAVLQRDLLVSAVDLVRPGGGLTYSVCTLTRAESLGVATAVGVGRPRPGPGSPWVPWGSGSLLLPQAAGTDGMALFSWSL